MIELLTSPIIKSDAKRKVVYCLLYPSMAKDTDREAMTPQQMDKSVARFIAEGRLNKVDVNHDFQESGCEIKEYFTVREGDPDFPEYVGDWVFGIQTTPEIWTKYEKGELNGLSWGTGKPCTRTPCLVDVWKPVSATGKCEKRGAGFLAEHDHDMSLKWDDNGKVVPTYTEEAYGHVHGVIGNSVTESNLDHAHPYIVNRPRRTVKFNPNHDETGQFSSADGATTHTGAHPDDKALAERTVSVAQKSVDKALSIVSSFKETTLNATKFMTEIEGPLILASLVIPPAAPIAAGAGQVLAVLGGLHLAVSATEAALESVKEELAKPDVTPEKIAQSDAGKHALKAAQHVKDLANQLKQAESDASSESDTSTQTQVETVGDVTPGPKPVPHEAAA